MHLAVLTHGKEVHGTAFARCVLFAAGLYGSHAKAFLGAAQGQRNNCIERSGRNRTPDNFYSFPFSKRSLKTITGRARNWPLCLWENVLGRRISCVGVRLAFTGRRSY